MNTARQDGFSIAPFAADGASLGTGFWHFSKLSPKWIETCRGFLVAHGASFRASWGQQLDRIDTKLTAANGAGIGTFYVDGIPAASTLYLSGANEAVDEEVRQLFIGSMLNVQAVRACASTPTPFSSIRAIRDRPLCVVVVWQDERISDEDSALVRELSNHFAAAFFQLELSTVEQYARHR
jgi:hypothetical protein